MFARADERAMIVTGRDLLAVDDKLLCKEVIVTVNGHDFADNPNLLTGRKSLLCFLRKIGPYRNI